MNSILNNSAALSALQSLNMTQAALATTQNQVSSGLAVANASDNAAYWSISTQLNADSGMVSAANSAMATSQAVLDTTNSAIKSIITTINQIQTALTEATQPNADLTDIGTSLASLGQQLTDAVTGASFNGTNLLDGTNTAIFGTSSAANTTVSFVSGYNATTQNVTVVTMALADAGSSAASGFYVPPASAGSGSAGSGLLGAATGTYYASTGGATYDLTQLAYYSSSAGASSAATIGSTVGFNTLTQGNIEDMLTAVNSALSNVTNYAATIGATQDRLSSMSNFNSALTTNYSNGVEALIDADMNTASTRLQALQTQEQLGIQSLSIANQNAQLILKLFP